MLLLLLLMIKTPMKGMYSDLNVRVLTCLDSSPRASVTGLETFCLVAGF
jgi:hypothetical protein